MTDSIQRLRELTETLDDDWTNMRKRLESAEASVQRLEHVVASASKALMAGDMTTLDQIIREAGHSAGA